MLTLPLYRGATTMKKYATTQLQINNGDKTYTVDVNSVRYTDEVIVNKLKIGYARYWLILQNGVWSLIGDMPLCQEVKNNLVSKIKMYHRLLPDTEFVVAHTTPPIIRLSF